MPTATQNNLYQTGKWNWLNGHLLLLGVLQTATKREVFDRRMVDFIVNAKAHGVMTGNLGKCFSYYNYDGSGPSWTVLLLNKLVAEGLVTRRNGHDYGLTPQGRELFAKLHKGLNLAKLKELAEVFG